MHVWLIQPGEPLPCDAGSPRLLRTGLLAAELVKQGHSVTWWATTFNHSSKTQRAHSDQRLLLAPGYRLILLHTPGYTSNISLRRMVDHRMLGRRFARQAELEPSPDIIHCGFPTIELAYEATRFAKRRGVPCVIDARDMWPDIFLEAIPRALRVFGKVLLADDFHMARAAFRDATAITAHAPGFVDWGVRQAGRARTPADADFPFGYPVHPPEEAAARAASHYWRQLGLGAADDFVACFFGTFAARQQVDLSAVVSAARILESSHPRIKFVVCGAGPAAEQIARLAQGLRNVVLPGWVDYSKIWTLMRLSSVGLLPYLPSRDFALSIPNKAVEYLSAGLPVVTSLSGGYLAEIIGESACGSLFDAGSGASLAEVLAQLSVDAERTRRMSAAARELFEQRFRSDQVNSSIIRHLLGLLGQGP